MGGSVVSGMLRLMKNIGKDTRYAETPDAPVIAHYRPLLASSGDEYLRVERELRAGAYRYTQCNDTHPTVPHQATRVPIEKHLLETH